MLLYVMYVDHLSPIFLFATLSYINYFTIEHLMIDRHSQKKLGGDGVYQHRATAGAGASHVAKV